MPHKFAEKVLDLELEIEKGSFSMDVVNDLILLYTQAVEFYNGKNDGKY